MKEALKGEPGSKSGSFGPWDSAESPYRKLELGRTSLPAQSRHPVSGSDLGSLLFPLDLVSGALVFPAPPVLPPWTGSTLPMPLLTSSITRAAIGTALKFHICQISSIF